MRPYASGLQSPRGTLESRKQIPEYNIEHLQDYDHVATLSSPSPNRTTSTLGALIADTKCYRPPEGLTIPLVDKDGKKEHLFVPGDVDVYCPPYWVHRDPHYFPDPEVFLPDRWLGGTNDELMTGGSVTRGTRERGKSFTIGPREMEVFFPFQVGQFSCPGKNLAMWEMRSFLTRLAMGFDFDFAGPSANDAGAAFEHGMQDTFVITLDPLWLRFKQRG